MKIWLISDTHGQHDKINIPYDIDILIHSGDFANSPYRMENAIEGRKFLEWWNELDISNKILVPGNHDLNRRYNDIPKENFKDTIILEDSGIELKGIKFWGSPWTPTFGSDRWVYNMSRGKLAEYWKHIPDDTEFLITHGPAKGYLDLARDYDGSGKTMVQVGCKALKNRMTELPVLTHHVFGHIHSDISDGIYNSGIFKTGNITYINASVCDNSYNLLNSGYVIDYEK